MKNKKNKFNYKVIILVILVIVSAVAVWGMIKKSTDVDSGATKKNHSIQQKDFYELNI